MGVCLPVKKLTLAPLTSANLIENLNDLNNILKTQLISLHILLLKTQQDFQIFIIKNNKPAAIFHKFREDSLKNATETIQDFLTVIDPLHQNSMENKEVKDYLEQGNLLSKFFSKGIFTNDFEVNLDDKKNLKVTLKEVFKVDNKYYLELQNRVEDESKRCEKISCEGYLRTRYIKGIRATV